MVPGVDFHIGRGHRFEISIILPTLLDEVIYQSDSATSVLESSDGYLTFFVDGTNILALRGGDGLGVLASHCSISLTFFLEWVLFDKGYLPDGDKISLSEMFAGDSSPPLLFERKDESIHCDWNFEDCERNGLQYEHSNGSAAFEYANYVKCLSLGVELLITSLGWRSAVLGCEEAWRKWLEGYRIDLDDFRRHVELKL